MVARKDNQDYLMMKDRFVLKTIFQEVFSTRSVMWLINNWLEKSKKKLYELSQIIYKILVRNFVDLKITVGLRQKWYTVVVRLN